MKLSAVRYKECSMTNSRFAKVAAAAFLFVLIHGLPVTAAEVKVFFSSGISDVIDELGPRFEQATGHKLVVRFDFADVLIREIDAGQPFDVAVLSSGTDDLIKRGKIVAATRTVLGRTGLGIGVRQGQPKPDIGTSEAFKRTMLNANSIAYGNESLTGRYFLKLFERLGIAEAMKPKLKSYGSSGAGEAVARGEAQLLMNGISPILKARGVDLVGWLPTELQSYATFAGGVGTAAKEPEAGLALLRFLTSPAAAAVLKSKGLEPDVP
jgi:molybdate transport system substrate-binding protein